MKKMVLLVLLLLASSSFAQDYLELLEQANIDKERIVSMAMELSAEENNKFWPVYEQYQGELNALNNERLQMIQDYAEYYDEMTDDIADTFVEDYFAYHEARNAIKKEYYIKMEALLGGVKATRWLQLEHFIHTVVDFQISSEIPFIKQGDFLD